MSTIGTGPLRWADQSGPALRALLAADPDCVGLVPVGATEQHGPHLPTGTDTIIATALAEALSAVGTAIALPPLPIGASQWHGNELAGTIALAGAEVACLATACARWASHSGLRKLLFVNAHVGNTAALWLACDELRLHRPELSVGVLEWWRLTPAITAEVTADAEDWHANRAESALMLVLAPHLVNMAEAANADDPDRSDGLVFRYAANKMTVNGVTGKPSQATTELGEQLWQSVCAAGAELLKRGRDERPPLGPTRTRV